MDWHELLRSPGGGNVTFGGLLYSTLMVIGLALSATIWSKKTRDDPTLTILFGCALLGSLIGAKLGFLVFELYFWKDSPHFLQQALTGRTILGALLGGYAGVEIGKRLMRYDRPTGDTFAIAIPVSLFLGRIGCLMYGCCAGIAWGSDTFYTTLDAAGVPRWPSQLVEAAFQLLMALTLLALAKAGRFAGQLFHIYLMSYGLFRLLHEPLRDTMRVGPISVYQPLALAVFLFGAVRFYQRQRELARGEALPTPTPAAE